MNKAERTISRKYKVLFLVAVLLAASAAFYIYVLQATSHSTTEQSEETSVDKAESAVTMENAYVKPVVASELHLNTIQTVVSHTSDGTDVEPEQEASDFPTEERHLARIQKYLEQIRAIQTLTTQFIRKKDYEDALKVLEQVSLPQTVKRILDDIELYREQYITPERVTTQIFPQQGVIDKVVGHFVQVTKLPPSNLVETREYDRILNEMQVLTDYFYSEQFFKQVTRD
jgi:hypothetical protein